MIRLEKFHELWGVKRYNIYRTVTITMNYCTWRTTPEEAGGPSNILICLYLSDTSHVRGLATDMDSFHGEG